MTQAPPILVAQVSDIHLFADAKQELLGVPTRNSFQAVLARLQQLQPKLDVLLLTGDLSQDQTPESYEQLQNLLSPLDVPTYWLPGNHDCLPVMQRILTRSPFDVRKSFHLGNWNVLLLNSTVPGCVHGHLSGTSLEWLDWQLQQAGDRPSLVALHHPPFPVNSDWLDNLLLHNPDDLFAVLDRHPQVKLVLLGHVHQEFERERRGVHYLATPSTCIQFKPQSAKFALDTAEPGFRLLRLHADTTWETRVERVAFAGELDLAATGY